MTAIAHPLKLAAASAGLARMLGAAAPVLAQQRVEISQWVTADVVEASVSGEVEEHARLLFLPVEGSRQDAEADGAWQASIQLHYLRHGAEADRVTLVSLYFHPHFLVQWPPAALAATSAFRRDSLTEHQFTLSTQLEGLLDELCGGANTSTPDLAILLRRTEIATALFRRALDAIATPFSACAVPACRFLAIDTEREKIFLARDILEARTDDRPLTIKDLSRKVAMNECYLKKGFKALTGKTVYDFQHERRIARAQQLLEEGRSVSDVADTLHFSSISHFSTAFKKATGLKPCELLR